MLSEEDHRFLEGPDFAKIYFETQRKPEPARRRSGSWRRYSFRSPSGFRETCGACFGSSSSGIDPSTGSRSTRKISGDDGREVILIFWIGSRSLALLPFRGQGACLDRPEGGAIAVSGDRLPRPRARASLLPPRCRSLAPKAYPFQPGEARAGGQRLRPLRDASHPDPGAAGPGEGLSLQHGDQSYLRKEYGDIAFRVDGRDVLKGMIRERVALHQGRQRSCASARR